MTEAEQPETLTGWAAIPVTLVRSTTLSGNAKLVYLSLSSRLGYSAGNWPSHATIAAEASCSVATVKRALAELKAAGVIDWRHRSNGKGGQISNEYRLIVSPAFSPDQPDSVPPF